MAQGTGNLVKWGFIDQTGKIVIARQFSRSADFHNGLALVRVGDFPSGIKGYINTSGKFIFKE